MEDTRRCEVKSYAMQKFESKIFLKRPKKLFELFNRFVDQLVVQNSKIIVDFEACVET